jgi:hypothetical protein
MQVVGRWHATNIIGEQVLLLGARLSKPPTDGHVMVRHPEQNIFGRYPIRPGATTEVSTDFWVMPPTKKEGQDLVANVILIDQYGNPHKVKAVRFRGPRVPEIKVEPPRETIHSISDPIAKQVAAVLKSEVSRYGQCGRRVGGLGSIQTTLSGRQYAGVGTEWREADSPRNQSIVASPGDVHIDSDNAAALLNLYDHLGSEGERSRFVAAMLNRLSRATEYACVGYLVLYVLFLRGHMSLVLDKAKRDLQGDDAYGFSDLLRLLDALLRFRHDLFDEDMLDAVERFAEGLNEHTFGIAERLASIRASRLAARGGDNKTGTV